MSHDINKNMEKTGDSKKSNLFSSIFKNKAFVIIIFGIGIRLIMLFYYYYSNIFVSQWRWGDIEAFFTTNRESPPLSIALLTLFRLLSFGNLELFVFWAFLCDLLTCLMFYFVLKSFNVEDITYAFGLFLINAFYFLNNSFSIEVCGYNFTDSYFYFFFFMTLIFLPKKEPKARYLFYVFLGLSMCVKYYTIPALGFFFLKYLYEKNWVEMKKFLICIIPLLLIFLVFPLMFLESYRNAIFNYPNVGGVPLIIRIIPIGIVFIVYTLFRLKDAKDYEIIIVSIIATATFLIFSYTYVRWFQFIIFYGILTQK